MKATELVKYINELIDKHGDLDVCVYLVGEDYYCDVSTIYKSSYIIDDFDTDDEKEVDVFAIEY